MKRKAASSSAHRFDLASASLCAREEKSRFHWQISIWQMRTTLIHYNVKLLSAKKITFKHLLCHLGIRLERNFYEKKNTAVCQPTKCCRIIWAIQRTFFYCLAKIWNRVMHRAFCFANMHVTIVLANTTVGSESHHWSNGTKIILMSQVRCPSLPSLQC